MLMCLTVYTGGIHIHTIHTHYTPYTHLKHTIGVVKMALALLSLPVCLSPACPPFSSPTSVS